MQMVNDSWLSPVKSGSIDNPMLEVGTSLRWGILGTGGIAGLFTRQVLASGGQVQAVASRSLEKAQDFVKRFGSGRYGTRFGSVPGGAASEGGAHIESAYGSYEELFQDGEVEAIYIATPHSDHLQWALKALNAGKPLLIEKAITQNAREAEQIFELAQSKNLFVMEAMWTRFLPHMREVKRLVEEGVLGDIVSLDANFGIRKDYDPAHRLFNPDLAGGALLDLGVYPISFAHHILGVPSSITSKMQFAPTGVDANLSMIFEYEDSGAQALLHTTSLAQTSTRAAVCGTKGRIEIDFPFYRPSGFTLFTNDGAKYTYQNKRETPELLGDDGRYGMQFEAAEVARCIKAGKTQSETMPWAHSLEVMQIMDKIRAEHGFRLPKELV
jgi:predicted dehydrogenase